MLNKKNIAVAMAAATTMTTMAPMANVVFADVIDSNQTEEVKALKQRVYDKLNTKFTVNKALLEDDDLAGQYVYHRVTMNVTGEESDIECNSYAEFEKEFDKAFAKLKSDEKITVSFVAEKKSIEAEVVEDEDADAGDGVTYAAGDVTFTKIGIRVLEDGTVVDFNENEYDNITTSNASEGTGTGVDEVEGINVVYGTLADDTNYAKIQLSDDTETGAARFITVKNGDVELDLNAPKYRVVDGYYVDANGNSIKKFTASKVTTDMAELKNLGKGVIDGFYAKTSTGDPIEVKTEKDAIVKKETAVTKEDAKVSDLYEVSTERLTKKGNEIRKAIIEAKKTTPELEKDNLSVRIFGTDRAGKEVSEDKLIAATTKEKVDALDLTDIKVVFEQVQDDSKEDKVWVPVYEMTITEERNIGFENVINHIIVQPRSANEDNADATIALAAGLDRYETAIEMSKKGWKTENSSEAVILVSGANDKIVDGLTATPLAAALDAPVLLTKKDSIPEEVMNEINRLGAKDVYIVGGESAVSSDVENLLVKTYKKNVTRLEGADRYATSLAVAEEMLSIDGVLNDQNMLNDIFIVGGKGEADALSASAVAGMKKAPILLTKADQVDKDLEFFLKTNVEDLDAKITDIFVVGGTSSVSSEVQNKLADMKFEVERLAGTGRQETNAKVISRFEDETLLDSNVQTVVVAKSNNAGLVDALGAGALAARLDAHIVLATDELTETQEDALVKVAQAPSTRATQAVKKIQAGYGIAEKVAKFIKGL